MQYVVLAKYANPKILDTTYSILRHSEVVSYNILDTTSRKLASNTMPEIPTTSKIGGSTGPWPEALFKSTLVSI